MNTIWTNIQPTLSKIHDKILDDEEKSLGILQIKSSPSIMLRNWITYKIREQILNYEKKAYYSAKAASINLFKAHFNQSVAREIKQLMHRFNNEGKLSKFDEIIAHKGILCEKIADGEYRLKKPFPT